MIPNEILQYHHIKTFVPLLKFNVEYLLSVFKKENNFTTFFQKEMTIKNQGLGYYNNDGNILYSKIWINELEDEDLLKKIKQL